MGVWGSVTLKVVNMVSGGVDLRPNHSNTSGNRGSVTLGVVNMLSALVDLRCQII